MSKTEKDVKKDLDKNTGGSLLDVLIPVKPPIVFSPSRSISAPAKRDLSKLDFLREPVERPKKGELKVDDIGIEVFRVNKSKGMRHE